MDIIANYGNVLLILAIVFGTFMAWGIGANDVANAMGTSVGSGAVTIKQAIIIAVIFEFAGAILAGGEVTATIRKGILDAALLRPGRFDRQVTVNLPDRLGRIGILIACT